MKKILAFVFAMTVSLPLLADDRPIDVGRLPAPAMEFINRYFKDVAVSLATVDKELFEATTYEVFFANGCKVEFDGGGRWKDIDCQHTRVPEGAVPEAIRRYIAANYPGRYATEIDRDARDYEVKLDNGLELTFNLRFQLIGIDH